MLSFQTTLLYGNNDKLYAISGTGTRSIEFFDANNPGAGWQLYSQASFNSSRRPLEPFLREAPLCFSIMGKSASLDFRTLFYIQKIERVMLKHMDTSGKKVSNGRRSIAARGRLCV